MKKSSILRTTLSLALAGLIFCASVTPALAFDPLPNVRSSASWNSALYYYLYCGLIWMMNTNPALDSGTVSGMLFFRSLGSTVGGNSNQRDEGGGLNRYLGGDDGFIILVERRK
ncbi:MAG: hypothetical protein C4524_08800 [Candidatus Zixiibacteriota bacterium]|nr:MAG: hypothetical protein C4524_08800 [candidate division Zixibacteria bacterium]